MSLDVLEKNVLTLNSYHKTIMFILIDIYYNECICNEGNMTLKELIKIYNLMKDYERRLNNED